MDMFRFDMERPLVLPSDGVRFFRDIDFEAMPATVPAEIRTVVLEKAERWLGYIFPVIPASAYTLTRRNGNRYNYEILLVDRWMALFDLMSAELITRQGRYIEKIMDVVWMNCEMSTWTIQSHTDYMLPTVDGSSYDWLELFSAEMGSLIAWAYYFFKDEFERRVPTVFNARIVYELRHRMLDNFMENAKVGDKRWRWFCAGGNWNIWIMTNILNVAGAIVTDPEEMDRIVKKVLTSAQVYLDTFPKDGICPEGPRYWTLSCGAFIDLLEQLHDLSGGAIDHLSDPILRTMLEYNMYFIKPGTATFNFGDAEICLAVDSIFLRRIAKRIGYEEMERYAASLYIDAKTSYLQQTSSFYRRLRDLFSSAVTTESKEPYEPPYPRYMESLHTYFDKTEQAPLYLGVKAHTNADPHGHVDTGSYIVYKDGAPVLIDPGLDCYSTFNWNYKMTKYRNAGWHNTMMFNGCAEAGGGQFAASAQCCSLAQRSFSCELAKTFAPEAQVRSWSRAWKSEGGAITVTDRWDIGGEGTAEMVLMTRDKPRIVAEEHKLVLDTVGVSVTYDPMFTPRVELLEESGSLNSPEISREHTTRLDFYQIAPRLPYEKPTVIPYPSSLQWGQPYLYRVVLRTVANHATVVTIIA
ncbi:MAG: heparinase II/III family protein [Clostridia bacterium]|nr:heparinase II/III family protein [Clostridia bacterium]